MSGMDMTELLPCPFCGNDGSGPIEDALHIMFSEPDWREDAAWSVQCDKCTATMGYSDSEDGAIDAWNRRASQAAPAPPDGLREAAQTLLDGAETGSLAELHHAVSDMFGVVDGSDKEDELFEALLEGLRYTGTRAASAPAQEGGE